MADGPTEGCTRCWCGAKYWDDDVCHSCGQLYHPDMDNDFEAAWNKAAESATQVYNEDN